MSGRAMRRILAADIGSVHTRALLFDLVEGEYRLVAQGRRRSAAGAPSDDAHAGFVAALDEIAKAGGPKLFDEDMRLIRSGQPESVGVDYCLTTTSAGPPIRALLIGLYADQDIAASRRAIAPYYVDVAAELRLDDGLNARARLNRIAQCQPQLVVITGGTDGGARTALLEMLAVLRQAVALTHSGSRPQVIYAGNSSLIEAAREMLSQHVEVLIAPNIRQPDGFNLKGLQAALATVFHESKSGSQVFAKLAAASDSGILPSARGIETMTAFFSRQVSGGAIAIDIGSAHAQLSLAEGGEARTHLRNDIGLGGSAASALDLLGEAAIAEWLPFQPRRDELAQYVLDKGVGSDRLPLDMRERTIEYAIMRAGMRFMLAELGEEAGNRLSLALLAGGGFAGCGAGALDMLLLADGLQCDGILEVKSDRHGALSALGALATVQPKAVVQLLNRDVLEPVGSLIRVTGKASRGDTALKVSLRHENGDRQERVLKVGDLWRYPLAADAKVELQAQTPRGLAIGGKRRLRMELSGGRGGLLFDARLDPLASRANAREGALDMLRWFAAATDDDQPVLIPESWLG